MLTKTSVVFNMVYINEELFQKHFYINLIYYVHGK